jgi:hypothetical protein
MKNIVLACLLATSAASAVAEWTKVGASDDISFYIDLQTISKDGNLRKVSQVLDLKRLEEYDAMSSLIKLEFDCKAERQRILAVTLHAGVMVSGKVIQRLGEDPSGWTTVPPGTAGATTMRIVCAK